MRALLFLVTFLLAYAHAGIQDARSVDEYNTNLKECQKIGDTDQKKWQPADDTNSGAHKDLCAAATEFKDGEYDKIKDTDLFVKVDPNQDTIFTCCINFPRSCAAKRGEVQFDESPGRAHRFVACSNDNECKLSFPNAPSECSTEAVCCRPEVKTSVCPYSATTGTPCTKDEDCRAVAKGQNTCLDDGTGKDKRVCCAFDKDEHKCPGLVDPIAENGKIKEAPCDSDFSYEHLIPGLAGDLSTKKVCCPFFVPHSLRGSDYMPYANTADVPKKCTKHDDCPENNFCDKAQAKHGKASDAVLPAANSSVCFPDPGCGGTVVKASDEGVKNCISDKSLCDASKNEFCDYSDAVKGFHLTKNGNSMMSAAVCCIHKCPVEAPNPNATETRAFEKLTADQYSKKDCSTPCFENGPDGLESGQCIKNTTDVYDNSVLNSHGRCCYYKEKGRSCPVGKLQLTTVGKKISCETDYPCTTANKDGFCGSEKVCCVSPKCKASSQVLAFLPSCDANQKCKKGFTCEQGHCCPMVDKTKHALQFVSTNRTCEPHKHECGYGLKFCDPKTKTCAEFGTENLMYKQKDGTKLRRETSDKCDAGNDCVTPPDQKEAKIEYVCIYRTNKAGASGSCFLRPEMKAYEKERDEGNPALKTAAIVCAVLGVVFAIMAVLFFLKYRSRHLLDHRKVKKGKKDKEDKKKDKDGKKDKKDKKKDKKDKGEKSKSTKDEKSTKEETKTEKTET